MEIINLGVGDGLPPVDWAEVTKKLEEGSAPAPDVYNARSTWLATLNEDAAHTTAVGAVWLDGGFWFQTGSGTRKASNVARDPRRSISASIRGRGRRHRRRRRAGDRPARRGARCEGLGGQWLASRARRERFWHHRAVQCTIARPPPWHVYRVEPRSATVVLGTEPGGLTRFNL